MLAIADTHAVLWYLLNDPRLSRAARSLFTDAVTRSEPIGVSTISIVEIVYLVDKGRIPKSAFDTLKTELQSPQSVLKLVSLDESVALEVQSIDRTSVPDMPDRIIAATAVHFKLPLISRDHQIRTSGIATVW